MAKAIITIEDTEGGFIGIELTFDPPVEKDEQGTDAQHAAMDMVWLFHKAMGTDATTIEIE